jgi:hypothetical protein
LWRPSTRYWSSEGTTTADHVSSGTKVPVTRDEPF